MLLASRTPGGRISAASPCTGLVERPVQLAVFVAAVCRHVAPCAFVKGFVLLLHAAQRVVADLGILSQLLSLFDTVSDFLLRMSEHEAT